ncbi:MAG: hypothetical protein ABJN98_22945 [Roseibium sp.]
MTPITSAGRANVRRKRPSVGETESERQTTFASHLPAPVEPHLERSQDAFSARYQPNSIFLAHLIATRDSELDAREFRQSETFSGADSYRATAALPRQRTAGHVIKTER